MWNAYTGKLREYLKKENSTAISVQKLTIIRSADLKWDPLRYRNKLDEK